MACMYFCVNVITSKENETKDALERILAQLGQESCVWFPSKENTERRHGVEEVVSKPLFGGYLFVFWDGQNEVDFPFHEVRKVKNVIRFLRYDDGSYALKGKDLEFAKWIHMHRGNIKRSKVVFKEGQKVHICEGPLMGFDGNVIKVDRHHKRIVLRFEIGSMVSDVNFSVEFLTSSAQSTSPDLGKL